MDAFVSSMLQETFPENPHLQTHTRLCLDTNSKADNGNATSEDPTPSMQTLPAVALGEIGEFVGNGSLSEACKETLEAHEFHFKINIRQSLMKDRRNPATPEVTSLKRIMEPQLSGRLASGRGVAQITITDCFEMGQRDVTHHHLVHVVKGIVRHSIPRLRSITIETHRESSRCGIIAAILGGLVARPTKSQRVAPNLTRVALHGGASAVSKAGTAIAAGLWPALEELDLSDCRASAGHFKNLVRCLSTGQAPNLLVLNWDHQSKDRRTPLDDVILSALSIGRCPRIEHLSFTGNILCPEKGIHGLVRTLHACPNLRELLMDCSGSPANELDQLTAALEAGYAPRMTSLFVRSTKTCSATDGTMEALKGLRQAAMSRVPPIDVKSEIEGDNANR